MNAPPREVYVFRAAVDYVARVKSKEKGRTQLKEPCQLSTSGKIDFGAIFVAESVKRT